MLPAYDFALALTSFFRARSAFFSLPHAFPSLGQFNDFGPSRVFRLPVYDCFSPATPRLDFTPYGSEPFGPRLPCGKRMCTVETLSQMLASQPARSLFAPRRPFLKLAVGSSFRVRYVPLGFTVPRASWNLFHYAPYARKSQKKNELWILFLTGS